MKFRGYKIEKLNNEFIFSDIKLSTVKTWKDRPCGHCEKHNTKEGYDGCIGTLKNVMNACCGHGDNKTAYIQYENGKYLKGIKAIKIINNENNIRINR